MIRSRMLLAVLACAVLLAGPAAAAVPAEQLLVEVGPKGFAPVPAEVGINGPIDLRRLAAVGGMEVPESVNSSDGYARGWSQGTAAVVGYVLTFDDEGIAGDVLRGMQMSVDNGASATSLPGVEGGRIGTLNEPASNTAVEAAVFGRGNAVFMFVGTGVARDVVRDVVLRQSSAAGAGAPPQGSIETNVKLLAQGLALVALVAVGAVGARKLRNGSGQPRPARRSKEGPVPAGTWSIGPPTS